MEGSDMHAFDEPLCAARYSHMFASQSQVAVAGGCIPTGSSMPLSLASHLVARNSRSVTSLKPVTLDTGNLQSVPRGERMGVRW